MTRSLFKALIDAAAYGQYSVVVRGVPGAYVVIGSYHAWEPAVQVFCDDDGQVVLFRSLDNIMVLFQELGLEMWSMRFDPSVGRGDDLGLLPVAS